MGEYGEVDRVASEHRLDVGCEPGGQTRVVVGVVVAMSKVAWKTATTRMLPRLRR